MKRILIITYYWPPSGGSGVQRWLKFVKYLTQKNYYCIIYTPENPEVPVIDESLLKDIPTQNFEVIKTKIIEPYSLYKIFTGKSSKEKITVSFLNEKKRKFSFAEKISQWIRGNCFIPDARMFWIKPSFNYLSHYIKQNSIDCIISTGPPHSMHLIALKLKEKFPRLKWIADFRDPWTNIDFLNELPLTNWSKKKHQQLEKKVVQAADAVISVSPTLTKELSALDNIHPHKFFTITNGFDEDDFKNILQTPLSISENQFTLTYAGLIPPNRNPELLWAAIKELSDEKTLPGTFKLNIIGKVDAVVKESISQYQIGNFIQYTDYLPHAKVLEQEAQSSALLLLINNAPNSKGILTGKLFEYLALQKPILAIGPTDGDAAHILQETNAGIMINFHDKEGMKNALIKLLNRQISPPKRENILSYSREYLTNQLVNIIEQIST